MFRFPHKNLPDMRTEDTSPTHSLKRRRFLQHGGLLAGLAAFTTVFSLTPPVSAKASSAAPVITNLPDVDAQVYLQAVRKSSDYSNFHQHVEQAYTGVLAIQEDESTVLSVVYKHIDLIVVRIPVAGGAGFSAFIAAFIPGIATISWTRSSLFTYTAVQNISCFVQQDGKTLVDAVLTPQGQVAQGTLQTPDGLKNIAGMNTTHVDIYQTAASCDFMGCFTDCFSGSGGAAWLDAAINVTCGIACRYVPFSCDVCLVTLLTGFTFITGYCFGLCEHCIGS